MDDQKRPATEAMDEAKRLDTDLIWFQKDGLTPPDDWEEIFPYVTGEQKPQRAFRVSAADTAVVGKLADLGLI